LDNLTQPGSAASTSPLRVFIVDDIASARAGMSAYLSLAPGIEVIGQAADGIEALEKISASLPDVVIMDIEMPRMDGVEATRLIKAQGLPVHVVVLSIAFNRREEALAAGADAFIHKGEPLGSLASVLEGFRPQQTEPGDATNSEERNPPITIIELETELDSSQFTFP
jgi:DNA-binding NarL/FixJ family response regulator